MQPPIGHHGNKHHLTYMCTYCYCHGDLFPIAMVTYPPMRWSTCSGKGRRPGAANVTSSRQGPSWWLDWERTAENLDNAADTPTDRQQSCDIHVTQRSCDIHVTQRSCDIHVTQQSCDIRVTSQTPTSMFLPPYCSGDLAEGSFDIPQQHISHG